MTIPLRKSRRPHPHCDEFNDYLDRAKNVVGSVWKPHDRKFWVATILDSPCPQDKITEWCTSSMFVGHSFDTRQGAERALWDRYQQRQKAKYRAEARRILWEKSREFPVAINSEVIL